jgi:N-acetylneuraminic acid mutarotase
LASGAQAQRTTVSSGLGSSLTQSLAPPAAALVGCRLAKDAYDKVTKPLTTATVAARQQAVPRAQALLTVAWEEVSPLTQARSQHAAQKVGSKLYVWGGYSGIDASSISATTFSSLEIYDASTNTWRSGANVPTQLRGQASIVDNNGLIYSFGGATNYSVFGASYRYNPTTDAWATIAAMSIAQWEASAAQGADGRIYVFGGSSSGTANQIYNPSADT